MVIVLTLVRLCWLPYLVLTFPLSFLLSSGSAAAVGGRSLGSEGRATGEEGDLSVPKAVEGVSPQIVSSDSEEGINKSTVAVVECSESSGVTYSETLHAEVGVAGCI